MNLYYPPNISMYTTLYQFHCMMITVRLSGKTNMISLPYVRCMKKAKLTKYELIHRYHFQNFLMISTKFSFACSRSKSFCLLIYINLLAN